MSDTDDGREPAAAQVWADRTHRFNAPISLLFGALATDLTGWMRLAPGEVWPTILESAAPTRVVWSSFWPVSPDDTIELDLVSEGREKTTVRLRWLTDRPPDDRGIGVTRQRLNRKIGGDLRGVVSEYFWDNIAPRSQPDAS